MKIVVISTVFLELGVGARGIEARLHLLDPYDVVRDRCKLALRQMRRLLRGQRVWNLICLRLLADERIGLL